jgi:hypothetical protein
MTSHRGFRRCLAALALAALLAMPQAAFAAAGPAPGSISVGSLWDLLAARLEAQLGGLLRLAGWSPTAAGVPKSGADWPAHRARGARQGPGASTDQDGSIDPNGHRAGGARPGPGASTNQDGGTDPNGH